VQILEEGMKWNQVGVDPSQAQALDVQKWTVDDCSRIFNIPPHKLGSLDRATFSNIEEQNIDFVASTMLYWFRKWELEVNYKLFSTAERKNMFCEILADGLLRGKLQQRYQAFATARQWGWVSVNDIRRSENMNPIGPEGDIYLEPLNMKPAGTETPAPAASAEPLPAEADRALVDSIATAFGRIIRRSEKKKKFDEREKDKTREIVWDSVLAYATMHKVDEVHARAALDAAIDEYVCKGVKLEDQHAQLFANNIQTQLGGNGHAIAKTKKR
jgi:hypothetical protein